MSRPVVLRRYAFGSAAAVTALMLSACSGGGVSDHPGDGSHPSTVETAAAPEAKQLNKEELATIIEQTEYKGSKFSVQPPPPEMSNVAEAMKKADIKPAECRGVMVEMANSGQSDAPTALGLTQDQDLSVSIMSYPTAGEAKEQLQKGLAVQSTCKDISMTISGQTIEMHLNVEEIDVPGADRAMTSTMSTPIAQGQDLTTVTAVADNGVINGGMLKDPDKNKAIDLTAAFVKAYRESQK